MAIADLVFWQSAGTAVGHVVDGVLLVVAIFLATVSGVGVVRTLLLRR